MHIPRFGGLFKSCAGCVVCPQRIRLSTKLLASFELQRRRYTNFSNREQGPSAAKNRAYGVDLLRPVRFNGVYAGIPRPLLRSSLSSSSPYPVGASLASRRFLYLGVHIPSPMDFSLRFHSNRDSKVVRYSREYTPCASDDSPSILRTVASMVSPQIGLEGNLGAYCRT